MKIPLKSLIADNFRIVDKICAYCDGVGYMKDEALFKVAQPVKVCYTCNGSGYLKEYEEIEDTMRTLPMCKVVKHEY